MRTPAGGGQEERTKAGGWSSRSCCAASFKELKQGVVLSHLLMENVQGLSFPPLQGPRVKRAELNGG